MNRKLSLTLLFSGVIFIIVSCTQNVYFDSTKEIEGSEWNTADIMKFSVNIQDTNQLYNIYINLRNKTDYPYSNLFIFLKTIYPDGKMSVDTLECFLADNNGKWLGNRRGNLVDNRILFRKGIRFKQNGNYSFEFEQAMRTELLPGIENLGLRIEKFETN